MKLATFEIIKKIEFIEGKDLIALATIQDYQVVVKLEDFGVDDYCVYIPIDTICDTTKPYFKFLDKCKGRVKTIKIGGEYSQGLAVPLSDFKEHIELPDPYSMTEKELDEFDLGLLLGVQKYEKDIPVASLKLKYGKNTSGSSFPGFPVHYIPITDESSLRSNSKVLKEMIGKELSITKKMDGSSMTLIWDDEIFILASRRIQLLSYHGDELDFEYESPMVDYVKRLKLREKFRGERIIIQGEFCGPKINNNQMKLNIFHWYVFTIYYLNDKRYYGYNEMRNFTEQNNFEIVPLVSEIICSEDHDVKYFQDLANTVKYGEKEGEGIVIRPVTPFISSKLGGKNASFKVINQKYKD